MTFILPFIWAIKIQGTWAKVKVIIFHFLSPFVTVHVKTVIQLAIHKETNSHLLRVQRTTSPANRFYSGSGLLDTRDCHLGRTVSWKEMLPLVITSCCENRKSKVGIREDNTLLTCHSNCNSVSYTDMYSHVPWLLKFLFLHCTSDRKPFSKIYLTIL